MKKFLAFAVLMLSSMLATAQTSFSNNYFSAQFSGGPVTSTTTLNDARTSTNYDFTSVNSNVAQTVDVRLIDHDIAVDLSSSNFYADLDNARGVVMSRSTGVYQGHPFTYTFTKVTRADQSTYSVRTRYIIVSPRVTIWVIQSSSMQYEDQAIWEAFEDSLNIK
jgi:hypothetical protein